MKKILAFIFTTMALWACHSTSYKVEGTIEGAQEGDTVFLGYSSDGQEFKTTSKTTIKDGKFVFEGDIEDCKIYYIGIEDDAEPMYAMFFLEPGNINADITYSDSRFTGTSTNDINIKLEEDLEEYVMRMLQLEDTLYRDSTLTEEKQIEISNKSYAIQREAMTYIQESIRENIDNMVGLFMLVQYSNLFDNNELSSLIASIPGRLIDRDNNFLYDILLQIQETRNSPGAIDDIINAIGEENDEDFAADEEYESDIVE